MLILPLKTLNAVSIFMTAYSALHPVIFNIIFNRAFFPVASLKNVTEGGAILGNE
jgi:hypothetical protein